MKVSFSLFLWMTPLCLMLVAFVAAVRGHKSKLGLFRQCCSLAPLRGQRIATCLTQKKTNKYGSMLHGMRLSDARIRHCRACRCLQGVEAKSSDSCHGLLGSICFTMVCDDKYIPLASHVFAIQDALIHNAMMPSAWKCHSIIWGRKSYKTLLEEWLSLCSCRGMRPSSFSSRLSSPELGHRPPSGCFLHAFECHAQSNPTWCSLHSLCALFRALYPGFCIVPSPEDLLVRNELQSSPPMGWKIRLFQPTM